MSATNELIAKSRRTGFATMAGLRIFDLADVTEAIPAIEAEARRAALTSLRERVAGLRARHPDHVGGPEVQLGQVLAEIDRALGDPD